MTKKTTEKIVEWKGRRYPVIGISDNYYEATEPYHEDGPIIFIPRVEGTLVTDALSPEEQIAELTSIALWSARRLHKTHKGTAYDAIERVLGKEVERL